MPNELARALESIAREAGAALRDRFGQRRTITKKGVIDLVTDADRAAEELILDRISRVFPGASVLAEESGASGPKAPGGLRFIVDPLDGTTNYAHGVPHFATTIAVEDANGLAAGVTFDPLRDELYLAARGLGAFCNGTRLAVNAGVALDDAVLATGLPYDVRQSGDPLLALFGRLVKSSRAVRRFGSAALDLAWVAHGRYDGYWELSLKPWDLAAGALLVREAGGVCFDYAGAEASLARGEAVAADGRLAAELLAFTRPLRASDPA